jgi:AraC-like DNA-binding protein
MDRFASRPFVAAVSAAMPAPLDGTVAFGAVRPVAPRIDPVSVADVLRNGFVYPPHSIFEGVTMQGLSANLAGRDPMAAYEFRYRDSGKQHDAKAAPTPDWVAAYHRHLCDAVAASCADIRSPWSLQSGGKDSTTLALALGYTDQAHFVRDFKAVVGTSPAAYARAVARADR